MLLILPGPIAFFVVFSNVFQFLWPPLMIPWAAARLIVNTSRCQPTCLSTWSKTRLNFSWPGDPATPLQRKLQILIQDVKDVGWTCWISADVVTWWFGDLVTPLQRKLQLSLQDEEYVGSTGDLLRLDLLFGTFFRLICFLELVTSRIGFRTFLRLELGLGACYV